MDLSIILTYIWIIIAIYALSPEYLKIKRKLSNKIRKWLFGISIISIFLLSFPSILQSDFVISLRDFIENIIREDIPYDIYFLILRIIQFLSIWIIVNSKTLRNWNIKEFKNLLNNLIITQKRDILFMLLDKNLEKIFSLSNSKNRAKKLYEKYCTETIEISINGEFVLKKEEWFFKKIKKNIYKKILPFFYKQTSILEKIMSDQISKKLWKNNENLWFKFMKKYIKFNDNWIREFSEKFLLEILLNRDSITYYQLKEVDYEKDKVENENIELIIKNSEKIWLEKNIDIVIHKLLFDEENKYLLNKYYSPSGQEYNTENKDIVNHIWRLIRLYKFIDKDKLWLSNIPIFLVKDLIEITDRDLFKWEHIYEYQTATYYLIISVLEIVEEISDETEWKYLDVYFTMIGYLLSNKDWYTIWENEISENFKKKIIRHCMYFFCNKKNREAKKEELKTQIKKNKDRKPYFGKDNKDIDRI